MNVIQGMITGERRREPDHTSEDRRTKRAVVYTACGAVWLFSITICYLAIRGLPVPPEVKDGLLFFGGMVSGFLAKTGVDAILSPQPVVVANTEANPAQVQEVAPPVEEEH